MRREELVYKEECYKIVGLAFEVFNEVGYGHKEIFYEKALAKLFKDNNIPFKEQLRCKLKFKGEEIGTYIFDFLVFDKIVVELKNREFFSKKDINQLYSYLKAKDLKLGILIYFGRQGVKQRRVVNLK